MSYDDWLTTPFPMESAGEDDNGCCDACHDYPCSCDDEEDADEISFCHHGIGFDTDCAECNAEYDAEMEKERSL